MNTYKTSKDYNRLVELMKEGEKVVCFADYNVNDRVYRDVARARLYTNSFQISARGIGYVWAFDEKDFIQQCKVENIEFLDPEPELIGKTYSELDKLDKPALMRSCKLRGEVIENYKQDNEKLEEQNKKLEGALRELIEDRCKACSWYPTCKTGCEIIRKSKELLKKAEGGE